MNHTKPLFLLIAVLNGNITYTIENIYTLRGVCYYTKWFCTTVCYRSRTTVYVCWTTVYSFWTTVGRGYLHKSRRSHSKWEYSGFVCWNHY